jgi:hypothetical protein
MHASNVPAPNNTDATTLPSSSTDPPTTSTPTPALDEWSIVQSMHRSTFSLPPLAEQSVELRDYIHADLYQADHIKSLSTVSPALINFHSSLTPFRPLRTTGDGNWYSLHPRRI